MKNIVIATIKSWNIDNAFKFKQVYEGKYNTYIIDKKDDLNVERIGEIKPVMIFFPHWSWIIPEDIYKRFECIVFHMTDLPYGRGGSPLQNLITRGITDTRISAVRVDKVLDGGDIYLKKNLSLYGCAEEIYIRASRIVFEEMIPYILSSRPKPEKQSGDPVTFKRRTPEDSEISKDFCLERIFDHIRMLDAQGYPNAYIDHGNCRYEFKRASLKNGKVVADVEIRQKDLT